jgi:hypothetical protein
MTTAARDAYIAGIDLAFAPAVLALDTAIMAVRGDFETRFSYGILLYALGGDFRRWIVAIDCGRPGAAKKAVHVRFLYGVRMNDPRHVLRPGTSTLRTIDFKSPEEIDPGLVTEYVREALARLDGSKSQVMGSTV